MHWPSRPSSPVGLSFCPFSDPFEDSSVRWSPKIPEPFSVRIMGNPTSSTPRRLSSSLFRGRRLLTPPARSRTQRVAAASRALSARVSIAGLMRTARQRSAAAAPTLCRSNRGCSKPTKVLLADKILSSTSVSSTFASSRVSQCNIPTRNSAVREQLTTQISVVGGEPRRNPMLFLVTLSAGAMH